MLRKAAKVGEPTKKAEMDQQPIRRSEVQPSNRVEVQRQYISTQEREERLKQKLCYTCPEKWHKGHQCKSFQMYIVVDDEDEGHMATDKGKGKQVVESRYRDQMDSNISCHYVATNRPRSLMFTGYIEDHPLTIQLGSGSSFNVLSEKAFDTLKLKAIEQEPIAMTFGCGIYTTCNAICKDIEVVIQNVPFTVDLHILPIGSVDMVLGMPWLKTLGNFIWDFSTMVMRIPKEGGHGMITLTFLNTSPKPKGTMNAEDEDEEVAWMYIGEG